MAPMTAWHAASVLTSTIVVLLISVVNGTPTPAVYYSQFDSKTSLSRPHDGAGFHSNDLVPEGYTYVGHSSQTNTLGSALSKQEAWLPAFWRVPSTGGAPSLGEPVLNEAAGQRQRSADGQHETLLFTHEGHLYTKE